MTVRSVFLSLGVLSLIGCDSGKADIDLNGNDTGEAAGGGGGPGGPDDDDDGDGFTNAEESAAGTNPDYAPSHPYEGGYNVGFCNTPPVATGPSLAQGGEDADGNVFEWNVYQNGDVVENLILMDQHGEQVEMHSFCEKHIVIAFGAGWCSPCRDLAAGVQAEQDEYREAGVQYIEVITQDDYGNPPDQAFLAQWAEEYGFVDVPVLGVQSAENADGSFDFNNPSFTFDKDGYIPSVYQFDTTMTVVAADEGNHNPSAFLE
jgi:thiol-disulfide isomerase/thioredoxin